MSNKQPKVIKPKYSETEDFEGRKSFIQAQDTEVQDNTEEQQAEINQFNEVEVVINSKEIYSELSSWERTQQEPTRNTFNIKPISTPISFGKPLRSYINKPVTASIKLAPVVPKANIVSKYSNQDVENICKEFVSIAKAYEQFLTVAKNTQSQIVSDLQKHMDQVCEEFINFGKAYSENVKVSKAPVVEAPVVVAPVVEAPVVEAPVVEAPVVAQDNKPTEQEMAAAYEEFLALVKADNDSLKKSLLEIEAKKAYEESLAREEAERAERAAKGAANILAVQKAKQCEGKNRAIAKASTVNAQGKLQGDKTNTGISKRQRKAAAAVAEKKISRVVEAPVIAPKQVVVPQITLEDEDEQSEEEIVPIIIKEQIVIEEKPVQKHVQKVIETPVVQEETGFTVVVSAKPKKVTESKATESKAAEITASEILNSLHGIEPEKPKEMSLYKMCKSFTTSTPCAHGDQCVYAHSYEQLERVYCSHGTRCRFTVALGYGAYKNKPHPETGRFCKFWHEGETLSSYTTRMSLPAPKAEPKVAQAPKAAEPKVAQAPKAEPKVAQAPKAEPKIVPRVEHFVEAKQESPKPNIASCSRLCNSVGTNTPCPHGDRCNFAHSYEALEKLPCHFGERCRLIVSLGDCCYKNKPCTTDNRICKFWHNDETNESYAARLCLPDPALVMSKPAPKQAAKPAPKQAPSSESNTAPWTKVSRK